MEGEVGGGQGQGRCGRVAVRTRPPPPSPAPGTCRTSGPQMPESARETLGPMGHVGAGVWAAGVWGPHLSPLCLRLSKS